MTGDNHISLYEKLSYGTMNFGMTLLSMLVSTYILYFYTDVLLLPTAAVSLLLLIVRLFDGAIDPFIGYWMDKRCTKAGKYIGYLRILVLPYCLLTALLFMPIAGFGSGRIWLYFLVYILWCVVYSVMEIANSALCISITTGSAQRSVVNTFKITASVTATLVISYSSLHVVKWLGKGSELKGFSLTATIFAIVGIAGILFGLIHIRERNYIRTNSVTVKDCLLILGKNKKLIFFLLMYFAHQIASGLKTQTAIYYLKYAFGRLDMVSVFFLVGRIGSLSAQPLIVLLSRRFKAIHLMIGAYAVAAAFMVLISFSGPSIWFLILLSAASSVASAFPANLAFVYLAEIADEVSASEKGSFSAVIGAMLSLSSQLGGAVVGSVVALVLHLSTYVPNVDQSDNTMFAIRICFIGFTSLMYLTSGIFAYLSHGQSAKRSGK